MMNDKQMEKMFTNLFFVAFDVAIGLLRHERDEYIWVLRKHSRVLTEM
jgi:hypothetical protein